MSQVLDQNWRGYFFRQNVFLWSMGHTCFSGSQKQGGLYKKNDMILICILLLIPQFFVYKNQNKFRFIYYTFDIEMEIKNMSKFRQFTQRKQNESGVPQLQLKQKYSVQSAIPFTERPTVSKYHHQSLIVPKNQFLADQKPNQLIPGVRFGRFFGSIEQATERLIRQKMVKENGRISVRESEVVNETVRGMSKGRESSNIEKDLLRKVEQLQEKLKKYEQSNPKLNKQNRKLEQANQQLRNETIFYQNEIFRWQKQLRLREQAQKQQEYKRKEFEIKLQKSNSHHNQNVRQVRIVSMR